jgi:hypothetical protein
MLKLFYYITNSEIEWNSDYNQLVLSTLILHLKSLNFSKSQFIYIVKIDLIRVHG